MSNELLREISRNPGQHYDDTPPAWWREEPRCDECPYKHDCTSSYTEEAIGCSVGRCDAVV